MNFDVRTIRSRKELEKSGDISHFFATPLLTENLYKLMERYFTDEVIFFGQIDLYIHHIEGFPQTGFLYIFLDLSGYLEGGEFDEISPIYYYTNDELVYVIDGFNGGYADTYPELLTTLQIIENQGDGLYIGGQEKGELLICKITKEAKIDLFGFFSHFYEDINSISLTCRLIEENKFIVGDFVVKRN